jgi:hypothetical protein
MHDLTTHANYIPELWPGMVIEFRDKNLVMAGLVDRRDIDASQYGDVLHYPVTSSGTAVTYAAGNRLTDNLQVDTDGKVDITIDQFKMHPFHIPWNVKDQVKYDTMALAMRQSGEAVARVIDSAIHTEAISGFTGTAQNDPAAAQVDDLALGDIVGAYVALNSSDVPSTDRAWVFHPSAYGELLSISGNYFTSFDFRQGRPLENGMIGQMLGSPVYQSTNVGTKSEGSPAETAYANLYFHRDALGVAMQHTPEVESAYDIDTQGILGNVRAGYGLKTLRADHGLHIYSVND